MNAASWVVFVIVILAAIGAVIGLVHNVRGNDDGPKGGSGR